MEKRETFSSRLGFVLISAGCAIGLGNVWRFPSITGQYGGAAFVLLYLLFLVILRVLIVARQARTPFYRYVCVGIASILIFQTVINIGMCLFVMPTIGITLPFFSYGGSSLMTLYMAMGVVSGIKKRSVDVRLTGRP